MHHHAPIKRLREEHTDGRTVCVNDVCACGKRRSMYFNAAGQLEQSTGWRGSAERCTNSPACAATGCADCERSYGPQRR